MPKALSEVAQRDMTSDVQEEHLVAEELQYAGDRQQHKVHFHLCKFKS